MIAAVRNATIIKDTGRRVEVRPFSLNFASFRKFPIVEDFIMHHCPHAGKTYVIVVRNDLSTPDVDHALVPPRVMR